MMKATLKAKVFCPQSPLVKSQSRSKETALWRFLFCTKKIMLTPVSNRSSVMLRPISTLAGLKFLNPSFRPFPCALAWEHLFVPTNRTVMSSLKDSWPFRNFLSHHVIHFSPHSFHSHKSGHNPPVFLYVTYTVTDAQPGADVRVSIIADLFFVFLKHQNSLECIAFWIHLYIRALHCCDRRHYLSRPIEKIGWRFLFIQYIQFHGECPPPLMKTLFGGTLALTPS